MATECYEMAPEGPQMATKCPQMDTPLVPHSHWYHGKPAGDAPSSLPIPPNLSQSLPVPSQFILVHPQSLPVPSQSLR